MGKVIWGHFGAITKCIWGESLLLLESVNCSSSSGREERSDDEDSDGQSEGAHSRVF